MGAKKNAGPIVFLKSRSIFAFSLEMNMSARFYFFDSYFYFFERKN
jgi:hypothetical protein